MKFYTVLKKITFIVAAVIFAECNGQNPDIPGIMTEGINSRDIERTV